MTQQDRRKYLIDALIKEQPRYAGVEIPEDEGAQKRLLRSLMNVRLAAPISEEFAMVQDEYLRQANEDKGEVTIDELNEVQPDIYIWQGDITRLKVGAIVNAANSGMTGCYQPCHNCIDNCIHTYAGIQLRNCCDDMMRKLARQAGGYYEEPTGLAKITPAFNLPCEYVIHTVGPIVNSGLTKKHEKQLASCYENCLEVADNNSVESIAFCCISTGIFGFPQQRAAEIATGTVKDYKARTGSKIKIIFNVFKDEDKCIYDGLLRRHN